MGQAKPFTGWYQYVNGNRESTFSECCNKKIATRLFGVPGLWNSMILERPEIAVDLSQLDTESSGRRNGPIHGFVRCLRNAGAQAGLKVGKAGPL